MHHRSFNSTYRPCSNNLVYSNYDQISASTIMVYVDDLVSDLLLIGNYNKIKCSLQRLETQLQLKHITKQQRDQPSFPCTKS
eukprot:203906-Amphidinium_carterae.4